MRQFPEEGSAGGGTALGERAAWAGASTAQTFRAQPGGGWVLSYSAREAQFQLLCRRDKGTSLLMRQKYDPLSRALRTGGAQSKADYSYPKGTGA